MNKNNTDYSLYLVTNSEICGKENFYHTVEQAILGGVTLIQIREKNADGKQFYETAVQLKKLTDRYNIPLIINDRVDIALAIDAAGVHLGQSDLPCFAARKILGKDKIIGLSARNSKAAVIAEQNGADYLGVGAMFQTSTKNDAKVVTPSVIYEIKKSVSIPIVAIGGIEIDNIDNLKGTGIDGIAVVSAIMSSKSPKKAAEKLKGKFNLL